jgi:activating signal cointegrator complex subunit 1
LQARVQSFTDALLASDPPIEGIDETIIVKPTQLHITLGDMYLKESNDNSAPNQEDQEAQVKTVQQALDLLNSLRAEVVEVLRSNNNTKGLRVDLNTMGTLKPDKKNGTAHVLWIGPDTGHSSEKTTLEKVAGALDHVLDRCSNTLSIRDYP